MQNAVLELGSPHFRLVSGRAGLAKTLERREYVHVDDVDRVSIREWNSALEAVARLLQRARDEGVTSVDAIATGRLRSARNGQSLVARVGELFGLEVRSLSPRDEAGLLLAAVRQQLRLWHGRLLVVRVGCEAVDFAVGVDSYFDLRLSLPLGPQAIREAMESELGSCLRFSRKELQSTLARTLSARLATVDDFQANHVVFVGDDVHDLERQSLLALVVESIAGALRHDRIVTSAMDVARAALHLRVGQCDPHVGDVDVSAKTVEPQCRYLS